MERKEGRGRVVIAIPSVNACLGCDMEGELGAAHGGPSWEAPQLGAIVRLGPGRGHTGGEKPVNLGTCFGS